MTMTVYQIALSQSNNDPSDALMNVHFSLSLRGSKAWNEIFWKFFQPVATVATDDLDHAFELMNLWNDESLVERIKPLHSLSVGDILKSGDKFFMVDPYGFSEIEIEA